MLRGLQIENYVLIKSLNIRFDNGFIVITGETGAGKSILMGALALILGNRAESNVLYDKSKKCVVEAEFDVGELPLKDFFEENDIDYEPLTFIRREILTNAKSRAFINDTPVTLQLLKQLTDQLIDIHSQHHHLFLKRSSFRIEVIDMFGKLFNESNRYQKYFRQFKQVEIAYHSLAKKVFQDRQQLSFLEFVNKELEEAQLKEEEQEELESKISFFENAELVKTNLYYAGELLSEKEEDNILTLLQNVLQNYRQASTFNKNITPLEERLYVVFNELKDISFETSKIGESIDFNPDEIEKVRERLDLIYSLQQKHHVTSIKQLLQLKEDVQSQIDTLFTHEEELKQLEKKRDTLKEKTLYHAMQLSEKRRCILPSFEQEILSKLRRLGMEDSLFEIQLSNRKEPNEQGVDEVDYLFSANIGTLPTELEKIASGGEISRVMLAIKSSISEKTLLPTIIFDEIDTGISGKTAGKVADLMVDIGKCRQLIAITHIPQIAAKGNEHYQVFKKVEEENTYTLIKKLSEEEREYEIAKMISGTRITESSLKAAKELINSKNR